MQFLKNGITYNAALSVRILQSSGEKGHSLKVSQFNFDNYIVDARKSDFEMFITVARICNI